ncbi:MAG: serine hydroxymethyltransferase, partial [bacterium]|nr:serine hydroxymethyltransferase [bacterium]
YDEIENLAKERALKVFKLSPEKWSVNVQPYSGSPANLAIYAALMSPGDTLMGMNLASGGHLTHGHKVNLSGKFYNAVQYGVNAKTGLIDYKEVARLAKQYKPKVIVSGLTAYPRKIDFKKFSEIAKKVGAYMLADISHIAGLVATKNHASCFPWCDAAVFTTHKNFRGPRGAVIISKKEIADRIDRAVFPTLQGGPHNNQILAKAIALAQALEPRYKNEQKQVIMNAKVLSEELIRHGYHLYTGGTDNHLMLLDFSKSDLDASEAEKKLEAVGILANRNSLPHDDKPFKPSGIRLGTPSVTARGLKEKDMKKIANLIDQALKNKEKPDRIKKEVKKLANKFIFHG